MPFRRRFDLSSALLAFGPFSLLKLPDRNAFYHLLKDSHEDWILLRAAQSVQKLTQNTFFLQHIAEEVKSA